MESCISDIKCWMKLNYLKLNDEKTEVLLLGTRQALSKLPSITVSVGDLQITSDKFVKNLGSIFDAELSMDRFISTKCSSAMYYLRCISRIRKFLDSDSAKALVHALVTSRLDYANSLLISANKTSIARLQVIQNSAARLIARTHLRDHITPIRKQLHWLPIEHRVQYKILVICFNCINGTAPSYLCDLIKFKNTPRSLRYSDNRLLYIPPTKSKLAEKCFAVKGPQLWNTLPLSLRTCMSLNVFKKQLKTHLFTCAY